LYIYFVVNFVSLVIWLCFFVELYNHWLWKMSWVDRFVRLIELMSWDLKTLKVTMNLPKVSSFTICHLWHNHTACDINMP